MQRTTDVHDAVADALLAEATCVVHKATPLDTTVDVIEAHAATGKALIRCRRR